MESTMTLRRWTAAQARDFDLGFSPGHLRQMFRRPVTVLEAMRRTDGLWSMWSPFCRVMFGCQALGPIAAYHFGADCAERALGRIAAPDPRLVDAVRVLAARAAGLATDADLEIARTGARKAADDDRFGVWPSDTRARMAAWCAAEAIWTAAGIYSDVSLCGVMSNAEWTCREALSAAKYAAMSMAAQGAAWDEGSAARDAELQHQMVAIIRFAEKYGDE